MVKEKKLLNEQEEALVQLKFSNNNIALADSESIMSTIIKLKNAIQISEKPDLFLFDGEYILGIEHMRFSSHEHNSRGDKIMAELNTEFKRAIFNKNCDKPGISYIKNQKNIKCSLEAYEKSFIDTFNKHYTKIAEYKSNLKEKFHEQYEVKIYFWMQDCTIESTSVEYNSKYILYNPTMNKNILEFLSGKIDVDAFIFQVNNYEKADFYYLKNSSNNIEKMLKENKEYFDCQINNKIINNIIITQKIN